MKITPTRSALIRARNKIKLARKGHKLLKQKRDVLIMEFFAYLQKARDISREINDKMARAYSSLGIAKAYHGGGVEKFAKDAIARDKINLQVKNIMGLKVPIIDVHYIEEEQKSEEEQARWIMETSGKIDEAQNAFEDVLRLVYEMAATENIMRKLIREIEKTKRRVNALEYVVIPRLSGESKMISFRLDELERESFFTLKMIKKKIASKKISRENA